MNIIIPKQKIELKKSDIITMIRLTGVSFDAGNSARMHNFPDGLIYEPSDMCFAWNPTFNWGKWSELFLLKFYIKLSTDGIDSIRDFFTDINKVRIDLDTLYYLRFKAYCKLEEI